MFKRTKGYFLLTMLVLTGLAGRIHSDTLTTKERRQLVTELKSSRTDFTKSITDLSEKQLKFKAGKNALSIKECVFRVVAIEKELWTSAKTALKQENKPVSKAVSDDALYVVPDEDFRGSELKFKTIKEALKHYKSNRQEMMKYVNTSTQDVRSHIAQTELGNFDAYQLIALSAMYCKYYTRQIEKIKATPNFPK